MGRPGSPARTPPSPFAGTTMSANCWRSDWPCNVGRNILASQTRTYRIVTHNQGGPPLVMRRDCVCVLGDNTVAQSCGKQNLMANRKCLPTFCDSSADSAHLHSGSPVLDILSHWIRRMLEKSGCVLSCFHVAGDRKQADRLELLGYGICDDNFIAETQQCGHRRPRPLSATEETDVSSVCWG